MNYSINFLIIKILKYIIKLLANYSNNTLIPGGLDAVYYTFFYFRMVCI